jgi:hypothetical protein
MALLVTRAGRVGATRPALLGSWVYVWAPLGVPAICARALAGMSWLDVFSPPAAAPATLCRHAGARPAVLLVSRLGTAAEAARPARAAAVVTSRRCGALAPAFTRPDFSQTRLPMLRAARCVPLGVWTRQPALVAEGQSVLPNMWRHLRWSHRSTRFTDPAAERSPGRGRRMASVKSVRAQNS